VKHKSLFSIVAFLANQILGIVDFQIEIDFFFHWLKFLQFEEMSLTIKYFK